jgi:hypothetical protein
MSNGSTNATASLGAILIGILALVAVPAAAQTVDAVVQQLVEQAEASNLELAGVEAGVAQRQAVLDQARARFLPVVNLGLRYSRADGGRQIDVPVGDLLNPVYASLNSLLEANGQPAPFTPIDNVSIPFLREREQQSSVIVTQPLFDARIPAAARAAEFDYQGSRQGLEAFRVRLRASRRPAWKPRWKPPWKTTASTTACTATAGSPATSCCAPRRTCWRSSSRSSRPGAPNALPRTT